MSPPTYAPSAGKIVARAAGAGAARAPWRACPDTTGAAMMNGATPIGSGSIPSASWVIVAFPASATSYTSRGVDASVLADLVGELLQRLAGEPAQPLQRLGVEHRRRDARDHVGAERLLLVEHRSHCDGRPRADVEECGDDRGRTEIERDPVQPLARVARLDVDQEVVDDRRT